MLDEEYKSVIIVIIISTIAVSGCTVFGGESLVGNPSQTQTPVSTQDHSPTETESPTPTPSPIHTTTQTAKPISTPNETLEQRRQHYREFASDYAQGVSGGDSNITFGLAEIDAQNRSVRFFHRAHTNNTSQYLLEQHVILYGYRRIIETYPKDEPPFAEEKRSWIPRTINVTVRTKDGRLYERAYIKYEWGLARANGEISERKYKFFYIGEAKPGPAHPEEGI